MFRTHSLALFLSLTLVTVASRPAFAEGPGTEPPVVTEPAGEARPGLTRGQTVLASLGLTVAPLGLAAALSSVGDGVPSALLIVGGVTVGPASGHFLRGEYGRGAAYSSVRGLGVAIILKGFSETDFFDDSSDSGHDLVLLGAALTFGSFVAELIDLGSRPIPAPRSVDPGSLTVAPAFLTPAPGAPQQPGLAVLGTF